MSVSTKKYAKFEILCGAGSLPFTPCHMFFKTEREKSFSIINLTNTKLSYVLKYVFLFLPLPILLYLNAYYSFLKN